MQKLFFLSLGLCILWACGKEPDCNLSQPQDKIDIKFYSAEDSSTLFLKFIAVSARGSDSTFFSLDDSLSTFVLPLNPVANEVTYVFQSSTSLDTLTVSYNRQLEWVSAECGPVYFYDALDIVGTSFTADLVTSFINISINENIKIYN